MGIISMHPSMDTYAKSLQPLHLCPIARNAVSLSESIVYVHFVFLSSVSRRWRCLERKKNSLGAFAIKIAFHFIHVYHCLEHGNSPACCEILCQAELHRPLESLRPERSKNFRELGQMDENFVVDDNYDVCDQIRIWTNTCIPLSAPQPCWYCSCVPNGSAASLRSWP